MNRWQQEKKKEEKRLLNAKLNVKRSFKRLQQREGLESSAKSSQEPSLYIKKGRNDGRKRRGSQVSGSNTISVSTTGRGKKVRLEDIPDPYAHLRRDDDDDLGAESKDDASDPSLDYARRRMQVQDESDQDDNKNGSGEDTGDDENDSDDRDDDEDDGFRAGKKNAGKAKKSTRPAKPNPFLKSIKESEAAKVDQKSREELAKEREEREAGRKKYYDGRKKEQRAFTKKTKRGQPGER
ncbi:hypothetical protein HDU97_004604 [Phlyctochytrium planicorne]|nr:hypothetical protein HDU97_004604 [Phlyctochytrium planicorne]